MAALLGGSKPYNSATDPNQVKVGTKNGVGVGQSETVGLVHKTTIRLTNVVITMTDAGAAGSQGSLKILDFFAGAIQFLGALVNLTTLAGAGGIADTGALVGAVGTVPAVNDNATLTTTEANIVPSIAGTLVGGAGVLKGASGAPIAPIDGTTTPVDVYLNLAVPDAGSSANDTITLNGTIFLYWLNLEDF